MQPHPSCRPGERCHRHATLRQPKNARHAMERREAPGSWAAPRGRMSPPARAFGRGARHRTSPCGNRLLRARCASRRSTAIRRCGCRPPRAFRTAPAPPDRLRRPASFKERDGRLKRRSMAGVKGRPNCACDFCKSLARACFFGAPQQNDDSRRCHAAPNRRSLRNDSLAASGVRFARLRNPQVFRTRPHRRPNVRYGGDFVAEVS